jgi:hypothetical protein
MMEVARTARFFSGRGVVFGQPKTHRSRRPVALSPETVRVLTEHRRQQLTERLRAGPAYRDGDLVFADARGCPLYDSTVRRAFYGIVREAGLEHLRIHDLRHTAATLMLRAGVNPKVVSERLGHAKVSITLDTTATSCRTSSGRRPPPWTPYWRSGRRAQVSEDRTGHDGAGERRLGVYGRRIGDASCSEHIPVVGADLVHALSPGFLALQDHGTSYNTGIPDTTQRT